jgi:hypothetical protein
MTNIDLSRGFVSLDLPSPEVANAPAAIAARITIMAVLLQSIFNIEELVLIAWQI